METGPSSEETLSTPESFRSELEALVARARKHGLDLERGWLCEGDESRWEIEFVRLAESHSDESQTQAHRASESNTGENTQ